MSGNYALTDIKHGNEDGSVVEFKYGDEVKGLDKKYMDQLREDGALGDLPPNPQAVADENTALREELDRVTAELEAALQKNKNETNSPPAPVVPPGQFPVQ